MRGFTEYRTPEMRRREAMGEIKEYARKLDREGFTVGDVTNLLCSAVRWAEADRLVRTNKAMR